MEEIIRVRHGTKAKANGALQIECTVEVTKALDEESPEKYARRYVGYLNALTSELKAAGYVIAGEDTKK